MHHFDAITAIQHGQQLYAFSAPAKLLYSFLLINEREPDKDKGYQRVLSNARVRAIAEFVDQGQSIAPAIVVSLDGAVFDEDTSTLSIPEAENAGWVIDGQHRLAGAAKADQETDLFVVAFLDLDFEKQIFQFVTINRTAKGVPTSLYHDLRKHLPPSKTPAEIAKDCASDMANELRRNEASPFFNRITVNPPQPGRSISLTNFVRKVAPLIQEGKSPVSDFSLPEQTTILENYFEGLRIQEPELFRYAPSIVFRTLGFGALLNALPTIFLLTVKHHSAFRVRDVALVFERIQFDFSTWSEAGSGNAAEVMAGNDLKESARAAFEDDDSLGAGLIQLV